MASEQEVLEHLKWMTKELRDARARAHTLESRAHEPIAVVGVGCRFPGGISSPEDLWDLVAQGRDAVGEVPDDRGWDARPWYHPDPEHPGTSYVRHGGFVAGADLFDAAFFGIAPREALAMDPQQRLLLETSWEAFERAGIDPAHQREQPVGVFIGAAYAGYGSVENAAADGVEGLVLTGSSPAVAAGRISYTFGFNGPAVTVDTMCSSSLVALHLAGQALHNGECSLALAAGAMIMVSPVEFIEFSRQRALAPDGRCKPFATAADGTGWAEGVGVVLLEPLAAARSNRHPIWAVLRGSAINHDGASNGLTAPSGPAQSRVLRAALDRAGLGPADVAFVEAHGTGTRLGDPIEVRALQDVYGRHRSPARPLRIGSIKSNIGHTQATSGIAGVIKTLMAMRHGIMPPTLHLEERSREIDWSSGAIVPLTESEQWVRTDGPRRAGVSSFGGSGTNAHVIMEEGDQPDDRVGALCDGCGLVPWPVSARTEQDLRAQAARLRTWAQRAERAPVDIGHALGSGRHAFDHRAVVLGTDLESLLGGLDQVVAGTPSPTVVTAHARPDPRIVFVFPGQGSQWQGMGQGLLASSPAFREALARCDEALAPYLSWSVAAVVRQEDGTPPLDRADVVQPTLWAVMVALAAVWRVHGVEPNAVIGHSQGELAAACVAGSLSLEDGARLVTMRSRLVAEHLAGQGAMASVLASPDTVQEWIASAGEAVVIGAVNAPNSVVVSGKRAAVEEFLATVPADRARLIDVDYASHSPEVEVISDLFDEQIGEVAARASDVRFYSTVTGTAEDTAHADPGYWWRNLRQPVRLDAAVSQAIADGYNIFVEVSAHPVVVPAMVEIAETMDADVSVLASLRRGEDERIRMSVALALAWTHGASVKWETIVTGAATTVVDLPTYPFRGARFWLGSTAIASAAPTERWVYAERWALVSGWSDAGPAVPGSWLLLVPECPEAQRVATRCVDELRSYGAQVRSIPVDVVGAERDSLAQVLGAGTDEGVDGVLSLLALDTRRHARYPGLAAGTAATLALIQAAVDADVRWRLWCATAGAVPTSAADAGTDPDQAQVWGLGRVAALEHPQIWGGMVDLPPDQGAVRGLAVALTGSDGEDQLALRATGRYVRRVARAAIPAGREASWSPHGTVLVTGATGSLGGAVARWVAEAGARRVVVTTRRDIDSDVIRALGDAIRAHGAELRVERCDLADPAQVAALAQRLAESADSPVAVLHTAGSAALGPLMTTSAAHLANATEGRLRAAESLDNTFGDTVEAMVLFGSTAGFWGSGDHSAYAAACSGLPAIARRRRARGMPATCIDWGVWALTPVTSGGPKDDGAQTLVERPERDGVPPMAPEQATSLLQRLATVTDGERVAVTDVRWRRFLSLFALRRPTTLFGDLLEAAPDIEVSEEPDPMGSGTLLRRQLAALDENNQRAALLELVREHCAAALGHSAAALGHSAAALGHSATNAVQPGTPLKALGFDSLMSVDLRNRLAAAIGMRLRASLIFDFPTPRALAAHLGEVLSSDVPEAPRSLGDAVKLLESELLLSTPREQALALIERLERVSSRWRAADTGTTVSLDDATDTELFTFIHDQLGKPHTA